MTRLLDPRSLAPLALTAALGLIALPRPSVADGAPAPTASAAARLQGLSWLAGAWRGTAALDGGPAEPFEATYTTPSGGQVLGMSKAFDGAGRLAFTEFERFAAEGERVLLRPYPDGRPAAPFALVEADAAARRAVFVNPDNDWPQRITFAREGEGLVIRCEGAAGSGRLTVRLARDGG